MTATAWNADVPAEIAMLCHAAEQNESRGRWSAAREQYEAALRGAKKAQDAVIARIVRRIARCLVEEGDLAGALDALDLARTVAERGGDPAGVAHAMNMEGIVAQQRGDLRLAEERYRTARTIAWGARDTLLLAMLDQNLGTVANIRGNVAEAKLRYESSLAAYRVLNLTRSLGPLHNNLGMLHTDLGQWREAERHFASAVQYARESDDVAGRLRAEANRAEVYVLRGRYRKAERICRRVFGFGRLHRDCRGSWMADAYKHLGVVCRETNRLEESERHFGAALSCAEGREDALLVAETLRELAVLYQRTDRPRETLNALTRAHALFTQLRAGPDLSTVDRQLARLEGEFLDIVQEWGESIESADSYTQGHSVRVADLACLLAEDAGFDPRLLLWFRMGALLHDVGKVLVPLDILNKRGMLSPDEEEIMRMHPESGEALVSGVSFPWDIRPMIRHHHERWDGTGYPDRLSGTQIPLTARILGIADVYDALTSTRSYRSAYAPSVAISIMLAESGRAFDPDLLHTFVEHTLPGMRRRLQAQKAYPSPMYKPDASLERPKSAAIRELDPTPSRTPAPYPAQRPLDSSLTAILSSHTRPASTNPLSTR